MARQQSAGSRRNPNETLSPQLRAGISGKFLPNQSHSRRFAVQAPGGKQRDQRPLPNTAKRPRPTRCGVQVDALPGESVKEIPVPRPKSSQLLIRVHACGVCRTDLLILFAPVGALLPIALNVVAKGGMIVCGGIHATDIPSFPYRLRPPVNRVALGEILKDGWDN